MSKAYYEDSRISQSQLKRFLNPNPRSLYRSRVEEDYYYVKEKIYFSKGKLMDLLISDEDISEYFYIESEDYKHPTEVVESIAQEVYDKYALEATDEQIDEIRIRHSYQLRYKPETALKWITETLRPIVEHKVQVGDKTVLTQEEFNVIATMANAILEGPYTKPIMEEYPSKDQVDVYCDNLKALIDRLQIDHNLKVFRVIDFKSTSEYLEKFMQSIKKYRYDIQISYYTYIVQCLYPDYKALEPILIVASTKEPEYAEPFTLSYEVVNNAEKGFTDKYGRYYPGWRELLDITNNYNQELYNKQLIDLGTNYINEL